MHVYDQANNIFHFHQVLQQPPRIRYPVNWMSRPSTTSLRGKAPVISSWYQLMSVSRTGAVGSRCQEGIVLDDCPGDIGAPLVNMATIFAVFALVLIVCFAVCTVCQWLMPWRERRRRTTPDPSADSSSNSGEPCGRAEQSSQPDEDCKDPGIAPMCNSLSICVIMAGEEKPTYLAQPCPPLAIKAAPEECSSPDPCSVTLQPPHTGVDEDQLEVVVEPRNDTCGEDATQLPCPCKKQASRWQVLDCSDRCDYICTCIRTHGTDITSPSGHASHVA